MQSVFGESGVHQISTDYGHSPEWSPDGHTLYYGTNRAIMAAALDVGDEVRVLSRTTVFVGNIDFARDDTNYDVHPITGELLLILHDEEQTPLPVHWILGWPQLVEEAASR